jgi:glycosyltransferase involved in cell wall biosynthesis
MLAARVRMAVASAPFVMYVSDFLKRRYPSRGRSVVLSDVILPPADPAVLERRLLRIRSRRDNVVLGLIGSWENKIKGIETAMEALARLNAKCDSFTLRVLGSGDPAALRAMARARGRFGVQPCAPLPSGQPVCDWLDHTDVYIQPSFTEGLPRGIIEAMSRACPVIGSKVGGIPELLPPVRLHQPGNASDLAEAIELLANDRSAMERDARQNFERSRLFASDYQTRSADFGSRNSPHMPLLPYRRPRRQSRREAAITAELSLPLRWLMEA